jgi:branched-chain amino acid transport system substrate-binding protein
MNKKVKSIDSTRRKFLAGVTATIAAPAILKHTQAYAANPVIKIGHVSPRTDPIAGFAEADDFVLDGIQKAFAGGVENNGKKYTVEVISKDTAMNRPLIMSAR